MVTCLGFALMGFPEHTGVVIGGPFCVRDGAKWVRYAIQWDDTGRTATLGAYDMKFIPNTERHITDGVRVCHCGPSTIDGIVIHNGIEDLN